MERAREMDVGAYEAGRQQGPPSSGAAPTPFDRSSSRLAAVGGATQSFDGALRELKDLQFQLHRAADCCEEAFLTTEKKKLVLDSTKSYICDAVVAVIDHLGTVSSKLEHQLQEKTDITQTEQKINFLKQRLLTCEQYAISLELLAVREDTGGAQYHRRYLSRSAERAKEENSSKCGPEPFKIIGTIVPGATRTLKPYDVESVIGRGRNVAGANVESTTAIRSSFSFRAEELQISPDDHKKKKKKASHAGRNILSFLKRSRRA